MPNVRKCQACRNSKKGCSRDGQVWNDQNNPETKCDRCEKKDFDCGPKEYKHENGPDEPEGISGVDIRFGAVDIAVQLVDLAPNPSDKANIEAELQRRLYELANSENFQLTRQRMSVGLSSVFPQDLRHALEDIVKSADLAHSKKILYAEVAYSRVMDWYMALGSEVWQPRQQFLMKVGRIYEDTGHKDQAELCYSKIFDDLTKDKLDVDTSFHHAIRTFHIKDQLGHDALMGIIRCCPPCRFSLRNKGGETPLLLAVSTAKEQVACAILERLRDHGLGSRIYPVHLDALDFLGQTLLTAAILSNCSSAFIRKLIEEGCGVNPEVWNPNGPWSPLQAALLPGCERIDIAGLLIKHGADLRHVDPNSSIANLITNDKMPASLHVPLFPELDPPPDMQNEPWTWE